MSLQDEGTTLGRKIGKGLLNYTICHRRNGTLYLTLLGFSFYETFNTEAHAATLLGIVEVVR